MLQRLHARRFFYDASARSGPSRLLDNISEVIVCACWTGGLLRGGHTGPILQAYRVADAALLDIGARANGLIDTAAITNFGAAASSNVSIAQMYDQTDRNFVWGTSTTVSRRPVIYEHGAGLVLGSQGFLAGKWVDLQYVTNAAISPGSPEVHVAYDRSAAAAGGVCARVGGNANNIHLASKVESATIEQLRVSDTQYRNFNSASNLSPHAFIMSHAAGATIGATTLRRDGVQLTEAAVSGGATAVSVDNNFAWGVLSASSYQFTGLMSHIIVIGSALTTANRAKIEAWQATYRV